MSKGSSPDPSKSSGWEGLHREWDGAVQRSSKCFQSTATLLWDKGLDEFPGASRRVSLVPWKQTLLEQAPAARSLLYFTATPPKQPCAVGVVPLWGDLSLATTLSAYCSTHKPAVVASLPQVQPALPSYIWVLGCQSE